MKEQLQNRIMIKEKQGESCMKSLGIFENQNEPVSEYVTKVSQFAHQSGFQVYRLCSANLELTEGIADGFFYDGYQWNRDRFQIPKMIYDRTIEENHKEKTLHESILNQIKLRPDIIFISYGLPDFCSIYNILKHNSSINPYLPETTMVQIRKSTLHKLRSGKKFLLRPIFAFNRNEMYTIQFSNEHYIIQPINNDLNTQKQLPSGKFIKWLESLVNKQDFMLQPFIHVKATIHVLLQKNFEGQWIERAKSVYANQNFTTYDKWIKSLPSRKKAYITLEINELLQIIPPLLETIFHRLFEFSMNIVIDENGALWLSDFHSKPEYSLFTAVNPSLSKILERSPVEYAKYLLDSYEKGEAKHVQILPD